MRRLLVVLSLVAAAAGSFAVPAAQADPMCTTVWTDGNKMPYIHPFQECVNGYPYGQYCETDGAGVDDNYAVYVDWCTPGIV